METAWGYAIPTSSLAEHSSPPAGGDEVPRLQKAGQVVERRIRVAAPEGLHQGGGGVVHGVAASVVPHGAALGHLLHVVQGSASASHLWAWLPGTEVPPH